MAPITEEKRKEFEEAARPLMKFMGDNFHPHTSAHIDSGRAELVEGVCAFVTEDYILD